MPGYDGTGPRNKGPMTGRGMGYCILKTDSKNSGIIEGFKGIKEEPVQLQVQNKKEVINMPRGDGTGPSGMGPMTGRAAGYCAGYDVPGYANPIPGRGFYGRGRWFGGGGRGRGWRNWHNAAGWPGWAYYNMGYPAYGIGAPNIPYSYPFPQITPDQEIEALKNQAKYIQDDMDAINDRIEELEKLPAEKNKKSNS